MAIVRIQRSKRKLSKARSWGQGNQWQAYWHSRKPARRSTPSPSSSSASISLVSSPPEECPSYYPWPWGWDTTASPTADLSAARSNYYGFLSEYMKSAAAALPSPPVSPHCTPNSGLHTSECRLKDLIFSFR